METPELNAIDRHLATLLQRIAARPSRELEIAAQLVSKFQADGHVCLPLRDITTETLTDTGIPGPAPRVADWSRKLRESGVVGEAGEFKPLILDKAERLYLQRYWKYEESVARDLSGRLRVNRSVEQATLGQLLAQLFPRTSQLQRLAAFVAATSNLCLVSGAPGTGKTRTIILICALLIALADTRELRIALAVPTGKAAARLKEALEGAKATMELPAEIADRLPHDASTVQRLLGVLGESGRFRHDSKNPLNADVVIVDEASMIDLALLAKLLGAVRPKARVILVGDKDQLASVEAGSAFRDLSTPGFEIGISESQARAFQKCTGEKLKNTMPRRAPIHDVIVELKENFRFAEGEAIAELSRAVNRGDAVEAKAILQAGGEVKWRPSPKPKNLERELRERVVPRFQNLNQMTEPKAVLARLNGFAVLCALRRGPFGAEPINALIQRMLFESGEIEKSKTKFSGQPLMIVRNDYNVGLFNGDIGIVLADRENNGELRAFFSGEGGRVRSFSLARLPPHETAFALTVHKSQGSEFREALVILPDQDSPVLTRELIYTAVTRARVSVELWAGELVFGQAIERRVRRSSGLREILWAC